MEFNKWLKRKYPRQFKKLVDNYRTDRLELYLKKLKYNVGVLKEDNGENKKGDLVIFKRIKEYIEENQNGYEYPNEGGWTGQFEYTYIFAKHSGMIHNSSYVNLTKKNN